MVMRPPSPVPQTNTLSFTSVFRVNLYCKVCSVWAQSRMAQSHIMRMKCIRACGFIDVEIDCVEDRNKDCGNNLKKRIIFL